MNGRFSLDSVSFVGNQALGGGGGAMADQKSQGIIHDSEFISNEASASAKQVKTDGGAIFDINGELIVADSLFFRNQVQGDGGAVMLQGSNATITSSTISENHATLDGGAFAAKANSDNNHISSITLTKNTMNQNDAGRQGSTLSIDATSTSNGLSTNDINRSSQTASATPATVITLADLDTYCKNEGYQGASLDDASTAYGWSCVNADQHHFGLSMTDVCRMLYPHQAVIDRIANIYDPSSWQCWLLLS